MKKPKFKRVTDWSKITGTSYSGEFVIDFKTLVEKLGEPEEGDGYKTAAEWSLELNDGTIITIYDWKQSKLYYPEDGLDVEDIKEWHIGSSGSLKNNKLAKEFFAWIKGYTKKEWKSIINDKSKWRDSISEYVKAKRMTYEEFVIEYLPVTVTLT